MITLDPPYRLATAADAPALAELVNFAGDGLPLHLWTDMAQDGEDPWDVGRKRQASKAEAGQIVVADQGQGAVAGLTGYVIADTPEDIGDDFPALFRPLQELENEALSSWYVNVLACYPTHRGKGIGSGLLNLADRLAAAEGLSRLSVIVASDNGGAMRLYERHGYNEIARRTCVRNGWFTKTDQWVLMIKTASNL